MIGYYVHHVGQGHLRRLAAVAEHLRTPVTGLSSLAAPPGWSGEWVVLPRDDDPAPGPDADVTAHGRLHWAPVGHPGLRARMAAMAAWVERESPALVVADVSVEVALLARLMGARVALMAMAGDRDDAPHRLAHDVADGLVAPWPELAASPDWPQRWHAKTSYVGAFSRFDGRSATRDEGGPPGDRRVLVLWGSGGDDVTDAQRLAAREATPGWRWTYRLGAGEAVDVWDDLLAADVVVVHGGSNAVAEVAAARRPAVVVAQTRPFAEQVARARAVDAAGIARGLDRWPAAADWPGLLDDALRRGGAGWSRWSTGDGARRAAAALDALAGSAGSVS